jgi:predicted PurR-regulated permease PerM
VVLYLAIIIASAMRSIVVRLRQFRVPQGLAILLVYGAVGITVFGMFIIVLPPVINQFANYISNEDRLATRIIIAQSWIQNRISDATNSEVVLVDPEQIRASVNTVVDQIRAVAPTVAVDLGGVLGEVVLVFVMGVYWLTSYDKIVDGLLELFDFRNREKARLVIFEIESSLGSYVRGVLFVAIFVGLANGLILALLRVPNAATLGFIIGVTTMLPVIGGFVGGISATLLAMLGTPVHGLLVLGTFVVVQQVETHYLTPRAMSRSMSVDPLLVLVSIFMGFTLYGVIGAIIAVPIIGTINILLRRLVIEPRIEKLKHKVDGDGIILNLGDAENTTPDVPTPIILTTGHPGK